MAKRLRAGDVIPEFRFDTPYHPQQSFYQLLEGDKPVFLVFLRNFGHPLTRHYIMEYIKSAGALHTARLVCVVQTKPQTISKAIPEGAMPYELMCDAEGVLCRFFNVPSEKSRLKCFSLEAVKILEQAGPETGVASWGLRYAASLPNVQVVLSGMSEMTQVEENLATFSPFRPLDASERDTIGRALAAYRRAGAVPCTACRYCSPCPAGVDIPRNLGLHNQVKGGLSLFHAKLVYDAMPEKQRASACVACGACQKKCPQKIAIPALMKEIAGEFQ